MKFNTQSIIAVATILMSFYLFYTIINENVNTPNREIVIYILGVISSVVVQIVGYYFGAGKDSDDKSSTVVKK